MAKNDPIEVRVDKMAEWAKGMQEQVEELRERMLPSIEQMDTISLELATLYEEQARINTLLGESEKHRAELKASISYNDEMGAIESQAFLDAQGKNPTTNKLYTEAMSKARAKIALNGHERYQKLLTEKRGKERELASMRAVGEELERQLSLGRGRARALCSRLDNLTARLR